MPISRILIVWLLLFAPLPAIAALALDGTASGAAVAASSTVATTTGITTTIGTDVIVAAVSSYALGIAAPTISSIAGCSLSWSLRSSTGSLTMAGTLQGDVDIWYAKAGGTTCSASTITATLSGAPTGGRSDIVVFAVSGADTTNPFDVNGTLPGANHSSSGIATPVVTGISTTNANTMLIAVTNTNSSPGNPGTGYTTINVANVISQDNEYQIVSSTQSSVNVAFKAGGTGFGWVIAVDAVQQASAGGGGDFFPFTPAVVP